jgi:positive regulator of sigma E activity
MSRVESEIGKVVEAGAGRARVEITQSSICAHCEIASSCVPTSGGMRIIEVVDPLGVSVHERVRIELSSGKLLAASFVAYILPVTTLLAGAIAAFVLSKPGAQELWSGVGALAGLAAGVIISRAVGQRLGKRGSLTPVITAVVPADEGKE